MYRNSFKWRCRETLSDFHTIICNFHVFKQEKGYADFFLTSARTYVSQIKLLLCVFVWTENKFDAIKINFRNTF